jgi:uncharacterized protein
MRFLFDLLHPAHVHFFRHAVIELQGQGHDVILTARDKDVTVPLIEAFGMSAEVISTQQSGVGLAYELVQRTTRLLRIVRRVRPDVLAGIMGPSIVLAGRLLGVPSVVFYDTEFAQVTNSWVYPLATAVCTPDCYSAKVLGNHVSYPGNHELAYLHPDRFVPDATRLRQFGLSMREPYAVVRFVGWKASHDHGEMALSDASKVAIVRHIERSCRVVISSEGDLPVEIEALRVCGPVSAMHHVVAFADVVVGESATMCSEAAVLGVPSVYVAKTSRGYIDDEVRYGLVEHLQPQYLQPILASIDRALGRTKSFRSEKRSELLAGKVDVTSWMVHLLVNRDFTSMS